MSGPCGHCALCVGHGKYNKAMASDVSQIMSKTKTLPLSQNLTCANYGICLATCVLCHEQCVGQTTNIFSKRGSSHRSNWNRPHCKNGKNDKDEVALSWHYSVFHGIVNKPPAREAHTLLFLLNNMIFTL